MRFVYFENGRIESPITPLNPKPAHIQQIKDLLSASGIDGNLLPINRVGFIKGANCSLIILPKFLKDIPPDELDSKRLARSHSELFLFFSCLTNYHRLLHELGNVETSDENEEPIFDLFLCNILNDLCTFLRKHGVVQLKQRTAPLYSLKGRILFAQHFARNGNQTMPVLCEFNSTEDTSPPVQFCNLFLNDVFTYFNKIREKRSAVHQRIDALIREIREYVGHASPAMDDAELIYRVEECLNTPEHVHWNEIIPLLRKFRNRLKLTSDEKVYFSFLIEMDKWFESLMEEVLTELLRAKSDAFSALKFQTDNSTRFMGGCTWIAENTIVEDSEPKQNTASFKTIPDASFCIKDGKQNRLVLCDFKYKTLRPDSKNIGVTNFDRADRYQLIAFFISKLFEVSFAGEPPPKLLVFYNSDSLDLRKSPLVLEFPRVVTMPQSLTVDDNRSFFNFERLRIALLPVNIAVLLSNSDLRSKELARISTCLAHM